MNKTDDQKTSIKNSRHIYNKKYYVYMLECADGSLYTGYTTDVARRLGEHSSGKGSKYTRGAVLSRSFILKRSTLFPKR